MGFRMGNGTIKQLNKFSMVHLLSTTFNTHSHSQARKDKIAECDILAENEHIFPLIYSLRNLRSPRLEQDVIKISSSS